MSKFTLSEKILACYYSGLPVMIWGDVGIGKTSSVKHVGRKLNVFTKCIVASIHEPQDFSGAPVADKEEHVLDFYPMKWVSQFKHGGILFFDEITTCPTSIQAALLTIVLDGVVGDTPLPSNVYRMAAGNYSNVSGCNELSVALDNRFIHIFYDSDPAQFAELILKDFDYELMEVINNTDNWDEYQLKRAKYRALLSEFIKVRPDLLKVIPESIVEITDVAFPTPRSWMSVIEILSTLDRNDSELVNELLDGVVGKTAALEFRKFIKKFFAELISIWDYKDNFESMPLNYRGDIVANFLSQIIHYLKSERREIIPMTYFLIKKFNDNGYLSQVMGVIRDITKLLTKLGEDESTITNEFEFVKEVASYFKKA